MESEAVATALPPLRPSKTVQKILISSPTRFTGEFTSDDVLISHGWVGENDPDQASWQTSDKPHPFVRHYFVLSFRTSPRRRPRKGEGLVLLPNYNPAGDFICSCLAVLFGKRFENHGLLESHGQFVVPRLSGSEPVYQKGWGLFSASPRRDIPIELKLDEVSRIAWLLGENDSKFRRFFIASSAFYLRAVQTVSRDADAAYLHLITAIEILSNYYLDWSPSELYDPELEKWLHRIAAELSESKAILKFMKKRLFQVKRRFVGVIRRLVTPQFFVGYEGLDSFGSLSPGSFDARISAAYDLRSQHVHTGQRFGDWVVAGSRRGAECQVGRPVVSGKEFEKAIYLAPTFTGMERLVRFCLLRFIHREGFWLDDRLGSWIVRRG